MSTETSIDTLVGDLLSNSRCLQEAARMRDDTRLGPLMARRGALVRQLQELAVGDPDLGKVLAGSSQWRHFRLQEQATIQAIQLARASLSRSLAHVRRRLVTVGAYCPPTADRIRIDRRG